MDEQTAAEQLVARFIESMKKAAKEVLGDLETDYLPYIQPDLELNLRIAIISELKSWHPGKGALHPYDARDIRAAILKEHHDQIIAELNQDLVAKIEDLEKQVETLREISRHRY